MRRTKGQVHATSTLALSSGADVSSIKTDEIKAKYKGSVLTLKMPKEKNLPDKARQIEIE